MITLEEFRASKKEQPVYEFCEEYGVPEEDYEDAKCMLVYERGLHISKLKEGRYYLLIERDDYVSTDLSALERILYDFGCNGYFD